MAVLPDVLQRGLKVVFCGTAVGPTSARVGTYYAGPGNQFWDVLYRTGMTPHRLQPDDFRTLPSHGIGLTDLAKKQSGTDDRVETSAFDVNGLRPKIRRFAPKALAFNGKKAANAFYGRPVALGRQPEQVGDTTVYVLPSTSGAARRYWDESHWRDLARFVASPGAESAQAQQGQTRTPPDPSPLVSGSEDRSTSGVVSARISDSRIQLALKVDGLIIRYFEETGFDAATPKELMPYLVRHGAFTKDHREGLPLRKLCRDLYAAGKLSLMSTAHFDQTAVNKRWYFVPPGTTVSYAPKPRGRTRTMGVSPGGRPMTLHDELASILRENGNRWMTTQELAGAVNRRGKYHKRDGSAVTAFQVHGRTRQYSQMFERDGSKVRLLT